MDAGYNFEPTTPQAPANPAKGVIIASWVMIGVSCVASMIPVLGFAVWLVAGPILLITFILGIVVLAKGGTLQGILILLASLIGAPACILVFPIVSSLLGLGGAAAVASAHHDAAFPVSSQTQEPAERQAVPVPPVASDSKTSSVAPIAGTFEDFKEQVRVQSEGIAALKDATMATETDKGYLLGSERLNMEQRRLLQEENVLREKVFDLIAQRTGRTRQEVAAIFSEMAKKANP